MTTVDRSTPARQPRGARPAPGGKTARPARRKKGEGQWALGYREPLNANEQSKKDDSPLNVRARIENIYAHRGFASIDPGDLRGPVPLVRALHPAQARHRRRQDRDARAARAGRRVLHAPGPDRRRRADHRAAAGDRPDLGRVRPRHRRRHRPAERPAALDPGRGRAGDLAPARGRRAVHHRGLRRLPAGHPRLAGRRHRRGRDHRPDPGDPRPSPTATSATRVRQPAAQVQDRDHRPPVPGRRAGDERHRLRRRRAPRARARLRPLGRRRAVDQPDVRPTAGRLDPGRTRSPRSGPVWSRCSATTATAGCAPGPGSSSWWPTGARRSSARCWRPST